MYGVFFIFGVCKNSVDRWDPHFIKTDENMSRASNFLISFSLKTVQNLSSY